MAQTDLVLALGGGGARGMAHIGVIRVLEEKGYTIRGIAGTSMGSIIGAIYCAGALKKYETYLSNLDTRGVLKLLDPTLPIDGLLSGRKLLKLLRGFLGDTSLEDLPLPLVALASDLATGLPVALDKGDTVEALRASFAIPGVFPPVRLHGKWLVDGGIAAPVPVQAARKLIPNTPVLAINVNTSELPPLQASLEAIAPITDEKPSKPGILKTVNESIAHMQNQLAEFQLRLNPPEAEVKPALKGVGLFDYIRSGHVIAEGRRAMEEAIDRGALAHF